MAYKPPGTYARFVKTASPVATAGGSRVMALVGTGINYYTIYNEAVTKSNTKPYDELKNNNVFEVPVKEIKYDKLYLPLSYFPIIASLETSLKDSMLKF